MKNPFPFLEFDLPSMTNSWWGLPDYVQSKVKDLVPDKDTWTLKVKKTSGGDWVFSLPQFLTFNESLTNGTELVLDHWFEKLTGYTPVLGSTMTMEVSKVKPLGDTFTTKLNWLYEDPLWPESNYYYDTGSGLDVWLCPYVQVLYKSVPGSLWVTFSNPV